MYFEGVNRGYIAGEPHLTVQIYNMECLLTRDTLWRADLANWEAAHLVKCLPHVGVPCSNIRPALGHHLLLPGAAARHG